MFHPFSSLNSALLKPMQVRPVLYFTAKMGATSVKKSSTGNMITIKLGKIFLCTFTWTLDSLDRCRSPTMPQLGSAEKYLFEFHYMLCNPHIYQLEFLRSLNLVFIASHLRLFRFFWLADMFTVGRQDLSFLLVNSIFLSDLSFVTTKRLQYYCYYFASVYYLYSSEQTSLASPLSI